MLQMSKEYFENPNNASAIINKVRPILIERERLYNQYQKKDGIPLEAYTVKVASGYLAGNEPKFSINEEKDTKKQNIIKTFFNKVFGDRANPEEFQILVDYINDYNDMGDFFLQICKDYFSTGACRWLNYENNDNEQVFARVPSWQCEIIYDYSVPIQMIGAVRMYRQTDANGNYIDVAILITEKEERTFINSHLKPNEFNENLEDRKEKSWYLLPVYGIDSDTGALFENVQDLINKLEKCVNNVSNVLDYNDLGVKLKITGFTPGQPLLTTDEDGKTIPNPARAVEEKSILNAKIFFTPDQSGDISWIEKHIDTSAVDSLKKTLLDYILMLTFIPNITDEGFTNADSNKALMKKFFGLQTSQQETIKGLNKELLRMWENIVDHINTKKNTKFDFRDINIEIQANIPTDDDEVVQMWLSLKELLSEETIISNLPLNLDVQSELAKKKAERDEQMEDFYNRNEEMENQSQKPKEEEKQEEE